MRRKINNDNMRRLIIVLILTALMAAMFVPCALAAGNTGTCGRNLKWTLLSTGVLTISGSGFMQDYTEEEMAPWYEQRQDIRVVQIMEGVTSVGDLAFYECSNLVSVILPYTVESIGFASFAECKSLKILNLKAGLKTIGRSAFEACESLQSVRFSERLTTIGERAFYRCYNLKTITIPASVVKIGDMAFTYCDSLTSAVVKASITEIPSWMFYGCSSLVQLTLASNIVDTGKSAFKECEDLYDIRYDGTFQDGNRLIADMQKDIPTLSEVNITYQDDPKKDTATSTDISVTQDKIVTSNTTVTETNNSLVSTTVSTTIQTDSENSGKEETSVKIEAVIENSDGWSELMDGIKEGEKQNIDDNQIQVDVLLNDTPSIDSEILSELSGKDVNLTIDMKDGSTVKIDCEKLEKPSKKEETKKEEAKEETKKDLSYELRPNESPTKSQIKTIGDVKSFLLRFNDDTSFHFSPKIYVGKDYGYQVATLYQNVPGKGLELLQSVKVDSNGYATYYLQSTMQTTQYVIALNVETVREESAIIPEDMAVEYGDMVYYESIQYVNTGVRLFMGLSLFQFSIAVFCVMLFLFVAVGIVMSILYRKKKLELYYQELKQRNA